MKPCDPNPQLDALLAKARDEIRAQRKSWVIGQTMLSNPEMTREEAERIYDSVPRYLGD